MWFCRSLIGACLLAGQQQVPDTCTPATNDSYFIASVNSALQFLKNPEKKPQNSIEAKKYINPLLRLGDGVSIAVLKIYDRNELIEPENAGSYLTAVRNAFSDQRTVSEKSDREPRITLFVLDYLQEKEGSNPGIEKRIRYMKLCAKDFTCSSQGEADFFKNH